MKQDEIIEMAQECGLVGMRPHLDGIYIESLLAFAKLVAEKALAEHAMQEVQRLGQEIEQEPVTDDIASILACRDMLDAQPVPEADRVIWPEHTEQEPIGWKLMPRDATNAMLKAMDECSTEGYDKRLYAGHAASVYMAAWDEAPTPPQRTWVGLTDKDWNRSKHNYDFQKGVDWAEPILKQKNGYAEE